MLTWNGITGITTYEIWLTNDTLHQTRNAHEHHDLLHAAECTDSRRHLHLVVGAIKSDQSIDWSSS